VVFFAFYAWRNWFVSLCATVLLMAVFQHPDMPKSVGGIQGLNEWNILLLFVLLAWASQRRSQGLVWDMPRNVTFLLFAYLCVVLVSYLRFLGDHESFVRLGPPTAHYSFAWSLSEYVINCVKWVIPGLLFYDACRDRRRIRAAVFTVMSLYLLIAIQVVKHSPLAALTASGYDLARLGAKIIKNVGYDRVNLSMMLAGASWAMFAALPMVEKRAHKRLIICAALITALGQAVTGGRMGYVTWGLTGLVLCLVRWRRFLPLIPLAVIVVCIAMPAVRDRMLQGIVGDVGESVDSYEMTSGRNLAWGEVIPMIEKSWVFGYGREAMVRTGTYKKVLDEFGEGETFPHPHNMYLEMLLDNGIVGFLLVVPFFLLILRKSFSLFRDKTDRLCEAVGGMGCALVLALLIAGMGSQTFYPREGALGIWAAIGITLRVWVERARTLETGRPLFDEPSPEPESADHSFSGAEVGA
jgi:O-antigen ligase